jgi:hypothetical protein
MARPPRSFHLQPKSGGYRARVLVPVELQGKLGKKVLCTRVWQVSETEAAKLAWPEVQKFEAMIEQARSGKSYPTIEMEADGPLRPIRERNSTGKPISGLLPSSSVTMTGRG